MQFTIDQQALTDRFMRYVQIDTQSDPQSTANPSTEKQKNLSRLLCAEWKQMGLEDVSTDDYGYVYATIPANTDRTDVPVIAFCSHVDTAPDCSGTGVKPILHEPYDGSDIVLPDDPAQVLRLSASPYLNQHIGSGIITASGTTLLGADDKSGVAIIMQAMQTLLANPTIKHGTIKVVFTPDEEVGRGTEKIDLHKLGADVGYTLDGGEAGTLEDESFSADAAQIIIHGVSVHPGYAKGVLVNAIKIAGAILDALPKTAWSPETTEGREGFVHPVSVQGIAEKTTIGFIVRDFTNEGLRTHHERLKALAASVVSQFPGASFEYVEQEQYRNMKSVLDQHPKVKQLAERAIEKAGLTVRCEPIRGGTDGSRLSFMGLPTLNLFTGMQNIHGKLEWVGVKDMVKAAETIVYLCNLWESAA
jgi:tripeptide aminopeptidase